MAVGENVSFANLKAMLHTFVERFFERPLGMRLRPSYFHYGAFRGSRYRMRVLQRHRLPGLQADRLVEILGCG